MPVPKNFGKDAKVEPLDDAPKNFGSDAKVEPLDSGDTSASSIESLTANPTKQGTYKLIAPSGFGSTDGLMIPYGNVRTALQQGFKFHPTSGDDTRYANDLFTELKKKGQPVSGSENDLKDQYGVVPNPAAGSKEWNQLGETKLAHSATDMLPTAGAIIGGSIGAAGGAVTGPADILTTSWGAGLGAGVGEAAKQGVNHYAFGEQQTPMDRAKHVSQQVLLGGALEGSGRVAALPLGMAARYFGFTGDASAKAGIRLLPSEAEGKAPSWLEEFLKGSVLSKGIMEKFRAAQNKESIAAADKLMDGISSYKGHPEQLGLMIQKGLEESEAQLRAQQNTLYGALDNITEKEVTPATTKLVPKLDKFGKPVKNKSGKVVMQTVTVPPRTQVMPSMAGLKQFAEEQLEKINKPPYFLPPDAAEKAREAFNTILQNPDRVSFKRMRDMRSVMLSQVRDLDEVMGGGKLGLAKKFASLADQSLEDAAKNSGIPGLYDKWRDANAITAEGHRMFEQRLVDKAVESENPEFIASLLGGKTIGLQQTRDLFKAMPAKLHDPVRRGVLQDIVTKATDMNGAFNEGKFADSIYKIGDDKGQIIFGSNWKNVKELSQLLGKINGPVGLGGGGGASLQNVGIMRKLANAITTGPVAVGSFLAGTGHLETGALIGVGGVAAEGAAARTVAWAMTNPAKAAKMLDIARKVVAKMPYLPPAAYYTARPFTDPKTREYIDKSKQDIIDKATPSSLQSSVSPQAQNDYTHVAVNPDTGHRVGSHDGQTWHDIRTGAQVA